MLEAKNTGLLPRAEVVSSERVSTQHVFYSNFPLDAESLAGRLVSYMAEELTKESGERHTLVPRQPEDLLEAGGIVFIFDAEGQALLESGSPEQIVLHIQGMAHLGLLRRDATQPDRVTDVEIRGVKAVGGNGAGREAIIAAAELAKDRFPQAQLFIMVNDGSEIAMAKLRDAGSLEYEAQNEAIVPDAYFEDCANCPVRPRDGCRRCCHTVLTIS